MAPAGSARGEPDPCAIVEEGAFVGAGVGALVAFEPAGSAAGAGSTCAEADAGAADAEAAAGRGVDATELLGGEAAGELEDGDRELGVVTGAGVVAAGGPAGAAAGGGAADVGAGADAEACVSELEVEAPAVGAGAAGADGAEGADDAAGADEVSPEGADDESPEVVEAVVDAGAGEPPAAGGVVLVDELAGASALAALAPDPVAGALAAWGELFADALVV
jgi:hypothetical protein